MVPSVSRVTSQPITRSGGAQTRVKLGIVGDYLHGFARAAQSAPDRIYIDGFAASGRGIDPRTGEEYDGSAALALEVDPPFTELYLVEQDPARATELEQLAVRHQGAHVINDDVNVAIPQLLPRLKPRAPTFAFLDPEGTELHWQTLERIADYKRHASPYKIELMILFPLQMAVLRLLDFKTGEIKPAHARRLDAMLGAETPWREIVRMRLFGELEGPRETEFAFLDAYCDGLHRRLGYKHVLHRSVADARGRDIYYLVFASDHDVGRKIARHEFAASHTEQPSLFNVAEFSVGIDYDPDRERRYRS